MKFLQYPKLSGFSIFKDSLRNREKNPIVDKVSCKKKSADLHISSEIAKSAL